MRKFLLTIATLTAIATCASGETTNIGRFIPDSDPNDDPVISSSATASADATHDAKAISWMTMQTCFDDVCTTERLHISSNEETIETNIDSQD
jgi:hypothetical protein